MGIIPSFRFQHVWEQLVLLTDLQGMRILLVQGSQSEASRDKGKKVPNVIL